MRSVTGNRIVSWAFVAVVIAAGCSSENVLVDNSITPNRTPILNSVIPADPMPEITIGETITFRVDVTDPDGDELTFEFRVEDSIVGNKSSYTLTPPTTGNRTVTVVATDGRLEVSMMWILKVNPFPDNVAPEGVQIAKVDRGPGPGDIEISWFAVGDDGLEGRAEKYLVATSNFPIENLLDWDHSKMHETDGTANDPGSVMSMVVTRNNAAAYTAVAVRAVDEQGNISPLTPYAEGVTRGYTYGGEVRDVFTAERLSGVYVTAETITTTTGSDGEWRLEELPRVTCGIYISDDNILGSVGAYYDYKITQVSGNNVFFPVYLVPRIDMESTVHDDFIKFFMGMTDLVGLPYPSYKRRWELPIAIYAPAFEKDGLDYKETIEGVALDLAADFGFTPFYIVDSPPDVGVTCLYRSDIMCDNYRQERTEDYYPIRGEIQFRTVYFPGALVAFKSVIRHELGHVLGLAHSQDPNHLMIGGIQAPSATNFTADEIAVIQLLCKIPGDLAPGIFFTD